MGTNGDYSEQVTITRSNETTVFRMEGTWQMEEGLLVNTVTNHSDPALFVQYTTHPQRCQIVRANDRELVIKVSDGQRVFRKASK